MKTHHYKKRQSEEVWERYKEDWELFPFRYSLEQYTLDQNDKYRHVRHENLLEVIDRLKDSGVCGLY